MQGTIRVYDANTGKLKRIERANVYEGRATKKPAVISYTVYSPEPVVIKVEGDANGSKN